MTKVSIITVNLNDKLGLERTIKSVLAQTFDDYEFIVIDGKSTDGSVEILEKYNDKIAQWLSEPDNGIYNAMNKGIKLSKGDYCYFLNAGDRLNSTTVLSEIFEDNPTESFICGNFNTEYNTEVKEEAPYRGRDWTLSLYDIYSTYLCHQAFFIRKDNFDRYGMYSEDLRVVADWELFVIAIGINHESVLYKDVNIVTYNMEGLSSSIGGKAIYEEKRKVAKRKFEKQLAEKLHRIYFLEQNGYIVDAATNNKLISVIIRAYWKLKRIFE